MSGESEERKRRDWSTGFRRDPAQPGVRIPDWLWRFLVLGAIGAGASALGIASAQIGRVDRVEERLATVAEKKASKASVRAVVREQQQQGRAINWIGGAVEAIAKEQGVELAPRPMLPEPVPADEPEP